MRDLPALLAEYLELRRSLGAGLKLGERLLNQFIAHVSERGGEFVTTELALEWALLPQGVHPSWLARRLSEVRHFASFAQAVDPRHEVPPQGLLPRPRNRCRPHIYTDAEIAALIGEARGMTGRIRPPTHATVLGLLRVTGMRPGEATRLDRGDVDLDRGLVAVRNSKNGKSRIVACHETTRCALVEYAARRDGHCPNPRSRAFFLNESCARIKPDSLRKSFAGLSRRAGLRKAGDSRGPRLVDMRHTFAVRTLQRWHRDGADTGNCLPHLSVWLGHAGIDGTHWYLTAVPELMEQVARRLDNLQEGGGQ